MADFSGRTILYTGAAGGLGSPTTISFLESGTTVIVLDYDQSKIDDLQSKAVGKPGKLIIKRTDLGDSEALVSTLDEVLGLVEGIDTVINNAAIYPAKPFSEFTLAEFQKVERVNVESAVICVQKCLPFMKEKNFGRIINISSVTLGGGWALLAPYVASKGALIGLTRAWAREFGEFGITSNAVAPGAFPTDAEKIHPDPEGYSRGIIERQAIKRRGIPFDIAYSIFFLAAKESGFITGQTLNVDGGWIMN